VIERILFRRPALICKYSRKIADLAKIVVNVSPLTLTVRRDIHRPALIEAVERVKKMQDFC